MRIFFVTSVSFWIKPNFKKCFYALFPVWFSFIGPQRIFFIFLNFKSIGLNILSESVSKRLQLLWLISNLIVYIWFVYQKSAMYLSILSPHYTLFDLLSCHFCQVNRLSCNVPVIATAIWIFPDNFIPNLTLQIQKL